MESAARPNGAWIAEYLRAAPSPDPDAWQATWACRAVLAAGHRPAPRSEVIAFGAVCGLYCAVMMAAMLALMGYRRSEYTM